MTTVEFNPRLAAVTLAKFCADEDVASARALVEACDADDARALIDASHGLVVAMAQALCLDTQEDVALWITKRGPDPRIAIVTADIAVDLERMRLKFNREDGRPSKTFADLLAERPDDGKES